MGRGRRKGKSRYWSTGMLSTAQHLFCRSGEVYMLLFSTERPDTATCPPPAPRSEAEVPGKRKRGRPARSDAPSNGASHDIGDSQPSQLELQRKKRMAQIAAAFSNLPLVILSLSQLSFPPAFGPHSFSPPRITKIVTAPKLFPISLSSPAADSGNERGTCGRRRRL